MNVIIFSLFITSIFGAPHKIVNKIIPAKFKSVDTLIQENHEILLEKDKNGNMMLHNYIIKEDVENATKLIMAEKGINEQNFEGCSPAHLAVEVESAQILEALIKVKANINLRRAEKLYDPLHFAVSKDLHEIVEQLLNGGANVDSKDGKKYKALHLAAKEGFLKIVQILLNSNANIDDDSPWRTALHEAVLYGHADVVRELLSKGADKEKKGQLEEYNSAKNRRMADIFRIRTSLQMAVENTNVGIVRILLENDANPNNAVDGLRRTALLFLPKQEALESEFESQEEKKMIKDNKKEIFDLLLHHKADVKTEDNEGYNVLGYAIKHNDIVTFEILMEEIREEIASGVSGDWTKVLEAEGKIKEYDLSKFPPPPKNINIKNALDISLSMKPINIDMALPLIRLEAHHRRSNLRMDELGAENILDQYFLKNKLDMMANQAKNTSVKTFGDFWDLALKYLLGSKKAEITGDSLKYDNYKENNVYIYYLAAKQYYPLYRRMFTSGDDRKNGWQEVVQFEDVSITPYRVQIETCVEVEQIVSKMSPIQRLDLEEKVVLLSIIMRESQCKFYEVKSFVLKAVENV